ncbi:MAG: Septum-associated cell division protein DedD [Burkholderiaceae bacterium]|jgi:DedD protein|nr:MAG: Septum-associated cell division protein DedD [Burkholderiaceae bacterium]
MAFLKIPLLRRGNEKVASAGPRESAEAMRQRAKHRLVGAAVLVLIGIVGFPLVFDTQPRPIAVNVPIVIPDKNSAKPLVMPSPKAEPPDTSANKTSAAPAPAAASPAVPPAASLAAKEEVVPASPAAQAKADQPAPAATPPTIEPRPATTKADARPAEAKSVASKSTEVDKPLPSQSTQTKTDAAARAGDAARAEALLDGKSTAAAADASGRFVVQVGAFADAAKARETRQKVEKAGLKTYTQVVQTKDGPRTRVRVGPFTTRADADRAAGRIKGLELPAAILAL